MSKTPVVYVLEARHVGGDVNEWKPVVNSGRDGKGTFPRKDRAIQFARELTTWQTFVAFRVLKGSEVVWEWKARGGILLENAGEMHDNRDAQTLPTSTHPSPDHADRSRDGMVTSQSTRSEILYSVDGGRLECLAVLERDGELTLVNTCTPEQEAASVLRPVWRDGAIVVDENFAVIRQRVRGGLGDVSTVSADSDCGTAALR